MSAEPKLKNKLPGKLAISKNEFGFFIVFDTGNQHVELQHYSELFYMNPKELNNRILEYGARTELSGLPLFIIKEAAQTCIDELLTPYLVMNELLQNSI